MNHDATENLRLDVGQQRAAMKEDSGREVVRRASIAPPIARLPALGRGSVVLAVYAGIVLIPVLVFGALAVGWIGADAAVLLLFAALFIATGMASVAGLYALARWRKHADDLRAQSAAAADELQVARDTINRQQRALVQTEKMAAMGKMAAGVAHEIANPLSSMDSILQLAQRRAATSDGCADRFLDRPEMVDALREQTARINRIVNQLTDFAHPNGEHQRTISTCELVSQSLDMLRFDHRLREVDVRCQCASSTGKLRVVPQQIHQVLVNLILNALDSLAEVEEPRLTIRARAEGNWSIIEVSDNGPGIAAHHLGRVFEPFFTTKPPGCGTGLGLSICATIAQQHGGRIAVDSTPGRGATFSITLPTAERSPSEASPASGNRVGA